MFKGTEVGEGGMEKRVKKGNERKSADNKKLRVLGGILEREGRREALKTEEKREVEGKKR